jgi:hypothetical protein
MAIMSDCLRRAGQSQTVTSWCIRLALRLAQLPMSLVRQVVVQQQPHWQPASTVEQPGQAAEAVSSGLPACSAEQVPACMTIAGELLESHMTIAGESHAAACFMVLTAGRWDIPCDGVYRQVHMMGYTYTNNQRMKQHCLIC